MSGSRTIEGLLRQEGFTAGRLHVATRMKRMGIQASSRRPETQKPAPGRKDFPRFLGKLAVTRPGQVWAKDRTYIRMARRFVYLAAVPDWFNRIVLAWRISAALETVPCIETLEDAVRRPGKPEGNSFIEPVNSRLRAESLNAHWSKSLADARGNLADWRRLCNEDRPRGATGYNVPAAMHYPDGISTPSS